MTQIKICGLKTREALEVVSESGIDYIGFVFAKSKRQITPEEVRKLTAELQTPKRIGVFVNETLDSLLSVGESAGLDGFQLHGSESPELCRSLKEQSGKLVWKAWQVRLDPSDHQIQEYGETVDAILLDSYDPGLPGGTGKTFPWQGIVRFRELVPNVPLFVAGGLSADNVADLLAGYRPDGVDVSSGVETNGVKDADKMRLFIQKVRERD
ncbi:phosphoribosylanthranilate isomerase [Effusibacillus consociatus]|uniref:N-(5'-phosphoribosyl)anthranilate isomerase n=1 Tax=Effusibacillus consociatus TaxID=1117041 RepID=A0ABV9Q568_9BACL